MLPSNIKYIQDLDTAKEAIKAIILSKDFYLGTDTETTGLCPHVNTVRLIQIAADDICYIFDVFDIGENTIKLLFNYLLEKVKGKKCWVLHSFKFDVKMFWSLGVDFTGQLVYDTMLASAVINCGLNIPNTLLFVADRFLGIELDKTEQKSGWDAPVLPEAKIIYAANDVLPLKKLIPVLDREIAREGLEETFKLEMRAVYGFAEMEYFGIKLDTERLALLKPIYEDRLKQAHTSFLPFVPNRYERKNVFGEVVDYGIEMTSSVQVLKVLRKLNIPNPLYNLESRDVKDHDPLIPSTGADMVKLLDVVDYPVVEALLEYRKLSKLLTSYVYNLPDMVNPVTTRVHCYFNQLVSTGRSSSSSPNVNQIPRPDGSDITIRSCFVADKGFKYAQSDFSQVELRIVAQLCNDEKMLAEFKEGKDPYSSTAALLNNMKYEDIVNINPSGEDKVKPEFKKYRQQAKAVRLGFSYSMWYVKFRNYAKQQYGVTLTMNEAKKIREKYFESYPGLQGYHNLFVDKNITEARTLPPFNRKRKWESYPGVPALSNHPSQGTGGDIQKLAIARIYEELHKDGYSPTQSHDARLVLTVHDELEIEVKEQIAEYARELLQRNMVEAGEFVIKDCPIKAEADIVDNLAQKS